MKNDNLTDFIFDIAESIRVKTGTINKINPQDFSALIMSITDTDIKAYTGHADIDGLKSIGWDDTDIAYYQTYGVNWNEEDDKYHLVSDDNKALYGVINMDNIKTYKDVLEYMPKINTTGRTNFANFFSGCYHLIATPTIDTSNATTLNNMFQGCPALTCICYLDTKNVTNMSKMFQGCYSLINVPMMDTTSVLNADALFQNCSSLRNVPNFIFNSVKGINNAFSNCYSLTNSFSVNSPNLINISSAYSNCYSMVVIPEIFANNVTSYTTPFSKCYLLKNIKLNSLNFSISFSDSPGLNKESLLYMIENESAIDVITITLHPYTYSKFENDTDIFEALTSHPNISIAS